MNSGSPSDGEAKVHGGIRVSHATPEALLPRQKSEEGNPKLQGNFHDSPAKLWQLGEAFHRVPFYVCVMVGCRIVLVERMGINPILALS